jgi:hypothetical protein
MIRRVAGRKTPAETKFKGRQVGRMYRAEQMLPTRTRKDNEEASKRLLEKGKNIGDDMDSVRSI